MPALRQVVNFATLAIDGLGFATPVLGSIGSPLTVQTTELAGKTTPTATYAAAIAVIVSLMFVARAARRRRCSRSSAQSTPTRGWCGGSSRPSGLLSEKIALSAGVRRGGDAVMAALVSLFVHLDWGRFPLWVAALALGGLAFAALGVAIGGLAREVSAASLMAFLVSLPIAFVALVPGDAVSGALKSVLDAISFVFPFKAALQAVSNAFSGDRAGDRLAARAPRGADAGVRRARAARDAALRLTSAA